MTDDSEIVCLSDRVMAGRHSLTDQARREEIRGEEEDDVDEERGGKPGSFVFQSGEIWEVGTAGGKKTLRGAQVAAVLLVDDQQAPILIMFLRGIKD